MITPEESISVFRKSGIKLNPGVSLEQISALETEFDFIFPEDFKRFYLIANGFANWDDTELMLSLWPLEIIARDSNSDFIPFCDWLMNSHHIGFSRCKAGVYKIYSPELVEAVCNTFTEAIDLISINAEVLI